MTRNEFFGIVKDKLQHLAKGRARMPEYAMLGRSTKMLNWFRGAVRVQEVKDVPGMELPPPPPEIKVWDLVGTRMSGRRPFRYRVFACFVEAADADGYRDIKRKLRHWYGVSGLDCGSDVPYAGVLIVGGGTSWPKELAPDGSDLPKSVPFEMMVAKGKAHPEAKEWGKVDEMIAQAAMPETFACCHDRVKLAVDTLLTLKHGLVTVQRIVEETGLKAQVVANIFWELMAQDDYVVRRRTWKVERGIPQSKWEQMYIKTVDGERNPFRRIFDFFGRRKAAARGKWYVQDGLMPVSVLSVSGLGAWMLEKVAGSVVGKCSFSAVAISSAALLAIVLAGLFVGFSRKR